MSAPASASFLSETTIRQRAHARPSLSRQSSALSLALDEDGRASTKEDEAEFDYLTSRMPMDSSSPLKASDAPLLRRSASFTLEWAATQAAELKPEMGKTILDKQPIKSRPILDRTESLPIIQRSPTTDAISVLTRKRARMNLSISLNKPSPFKILTDLKDFVKSPTSCSPISNSPPLSFLLAAAKEIEAYASSPESEESTTDEESSVAAKKHGFDQTFSSVDSSSTNGDDEATDGEEKEKTLLPEEDQLGVSLLLGLAGH